MRSSVLLRGLAALIICGCLIGLPGCAGSSAPEDTPFTVTFPDARGLSPGDGLVYRGLRIGEVDTVGIGEDGQIEVGLTVGGEYRQHLFHESRFFIDDADDGAGRQVLVKDPRGDGKTPIRAGDRIAGRSGLLETIRDAATQAIDETQLLGAAAEERLRQYLDSPEGQQLVAEMREFGERAKRASAAQYDRFKREQLPIFQERMRQLKADLEADGRKEQAAQVWQSFLDWLEEIERFEPPADDPPADDPPPGRR